MFTNNFGEHQNISYGLMSSIADAGQHEIHPIPLLSVYVTALVIHAVAQVQITQNYVNKEEQPIEAVYNFPVDPDGAVTNFRVELDDRVIKGVVKPRAEAQEEYDKAVASGTTSFLGEEVKADIFKLRVGYLQPGAHAKITIEYVTEVKNDPGTKNIRFYIPTTIAPRYVSANETDAEAIDIKNMTFSTSSPAPLSVKVEVAVQGAIKSIQSPTHNVTVERSQQTTENDGWHEATVELSGKTTDMDRDFVIIIEPEEKHKPRLYSEKTAYDDDSTAVMIHLLPSFKMDEQKTELIFVLDRSGSMLGQSIDLAKKALSLFLHSMPVDCYFNVVGFGSRYEFLFPTSVKYDEESLRKAIEHANTLDANLGLTEILEPLKRVYEQPLIDGYLKQIFILTDGEVSNTREVLGLVQANAHKVRVFSIGIGDASSHYLVEGVAKAGGGTAAFVTYNESMEKKVLSQLKNALQPSLFNITIEWEGVTTDVALNTNRTLVGYNKPIESETMNSGTHQPAIRQSPKKISPVLDGSQLLVLGIFENGYPKSALITAQSSGGPLTVRVEHSPANNLRNGNLLHQLAAIKIIRELEMEVSSLNIKGTEAEKVLENEIIQISCQNGVTSRYTSFIASDVKDNNQLMENWVMITRHVPSQFAHGWHGRNSHGGQPSPLGFSLMQGGQGFPSSGSSGYQSHSASSGLPSSSSSRFSSSGSTGFPSSGSVYQLSSRLGFPSSGSSVYQSSGSSGFPSAVSSGYPLSGSSGYPLSGSSGYPLSGSSVYQSSSSSVFPSSGSSRFESSVSSVIPSSVGSGFPSLASSSGFPSLSGSSGFPSQSISLGYRSGSIPSSRWPSYIGSATTSPFRATAQMSSNRGTIGSGYSNWRAFGIQDNSIRTSMSNDYSEQTENDGHNAAITSSSILLRLISLQSYDGSFTLNEALAQILGKTLQELKAACVTHNVSEQKFATALAISFFNKSLADEKDKWELVEGKAQRWLSREVQPENVNAIVKLASEALM